MTADSDELLRGLQREILALRTRVASLETATGLYEPDEMLDRPKGDPKVNFAPRQWRGPDFVGKRFSECSPEFLDALAEVLAWAADNPQEGKERYAVGNRLDAKRARSWARRLRSKLDAPVGPAAPPARSRFAPEPPATPAQQTRTSTAPAPSHATEDESLFEDDFAFPESEDGGKSGSHGLHEPEDILW